MENNQLSGIFNEIYLLMKKYGVPTTEHDVDYLYLRMDTYKLVYEVDGLTLRKLLKTPINSAYGGKLTTITHKVLLRTKIENNSHVFDELECSEIELMAIHLEIKNRFDK